jgi:hypothetical protein
MTDTTIPDFFARFPMQGVGSQDIDGVLGQGDTLAILFLWGRDCPNCDAAKRAILASPGRLRWPDVRWLHGNVYEDPDLGTRFGLHGIPTFIVFRGSRRIGRITPWPGTEAFVAAIEGQRDGAASG